LTHLKHVSHNQIPGISQENMSLKKNICFTSLILLLLIIGLYADEELLKVEASISPERLSRSQEGKVSLKIKVQKGVTINPQPVFTIELSPSDALVFPKNFFTASDLEIEILEKDGEEYLNFKEPIEIPFTVSLDAKRGWHVLEGKVKYFACSKKEEWCLKSTTKFSASFYTRSSIVKKKK